MTPEQRIQRTDSIKHFESEILNALTACAKKVNVTTINGSICIYKNIQQLSYAGTFGSTVLNHCIKAQCLDEFYKKIYIVACHAEIHSRKCGGITISTV